MFMSLAVRYVAFWRHLERMSFFLLFHQEQSLQGSIRQKSQFSGLRLDRRLIPWRRFTNHRDLMMKRSEDLHSSASLIANLLFVDLLCDGPIQSSIVQMNWSSTCLPGLTDQVPKSFDAFTRFLILDAPMFVGLLYNKVNLADGIATGILEELVLL